MHEERRRNEPDLPSRSPNKTRVSLDSFDNSSWSRGRPIWFEVAWMVLSTLFVRSWFPGSLHRVALLRLFGADIGSGVVIKPGVHVKFPWRLRIGDNTWIGERVWIDNLGAVEIGDNVCVSQDTYLCTGSHDWNTITFDLVVKPISIDSSAWVAARSTIGPGVKIGEGAVLGLGSTTSKDVPAWTIYSGTPAKFVKDRHLVE